MVTKEARVPTGTLVSLVVIVTLETETDTATPVRARLLARALIMQRPKFPRKGGKARLRDHAVLSHQCVHGILLYI